MYKQFEPWAAFLLTVQYLWLQVALAIMVAVAFTMLSAVKAGRGGMTGPVMGWLAGKFISLVSFAFLGLVLAYFLSNGLVQEAKEPNILLSTLGAVLIPAITGGIAILENIQSGKEERPRSGMAVFLICTILCYQTFAFQIQHFYA